MRFHRSAIKQLRKMDAQAARRLMNALQRHEKDGSGDVKKLVNRHGYRIRVGDYRAIFEIENDEVIVLDVGPRGGVY